MIRITRLAAILFALSITLSGAHAANDTTKGQPKEVLVTLANSSLEIMRYKTVEVDWQMLVKEAPSLTPENVVVLDNDLRVPLVCQTIDYDMDGTADSLLFQHHFMPQSSHSFLVVANSTVLTRPRYQSPVYARFVPERIDDFAWENDRVAFRAYGPACREVLVSSGIDVWAKRVRYPIIDKWYSREADSYHKDNGEGLDFFTVGKSLGCGGSAVYSEGKLVPAGNYESYKVIANGPVRSVFELEYNPVEVGGKEITCKKRISIDAGHQLFACEDIYTFDGEEAIKVAAGLVKYPGATSAANKLHDWVSLWGPAVEGDASQMQLGTALLADYKYFSSFEETDDHALAVMEAASGTPLHYYAGFAWTKAGDIESEEAWHTYLTKYGYTTRYPLRTIVNGRLTNPEDVQLEKELMERLKNGR